MRDDPHLLWVGDHHLLHIGTDHFCDRRDIARCFYDDDVHAGRSGACRETQHPFRPASDGERIYGTFKETVQLSSGKYALIENSRLVPWRPVIERQLGKEVAGLVRGTDISWSSVASAASDQHVKRRS
jgi:hypothetical protein